MNQRGQIVAIKVSARVSISFRAIFEGDIIEGKIQHRLQLAGVLKSTFFVYCTRGNLQDVLI